MKARMRLNRALRRARLAEETVGWATFGFGAGRLAVRWASEARPRFGSRFTSATSAGRFRTSVETFVDNGYTDMHKLMRTLYEVDFRAAVIADHVPGMVGGPRTGWAYSIGYIKALLAAGGAEKV